MFSKVVSRQLSLTSKCNNRLIKFRHGAPREQPQTGGAATSAQTTQGQVAAVGDAMYDFQLPQRWRRKELDEEEIRIINNGGPLDEPVGKGEHVKHKMHKHDHHDCHHHHKKVEAIYDFQIPDRWKRKLPDEEEINIINNGGGL